MMGKQYERVSKMKPVPSVKKEGGVLKKGKMYAEKVSSLHRQNEENREFF